MHHRNVFQIAGSRHHRIARARRDVGDSAKPHVHRSADWENEHRLEVTQSKTAGAQRTAMSHLVGGNFGAAHLLGGTARRRNRALISSRNSPSSRSGSLLRTCSHKSHAASSLSGANQRFFPFCSAGHSCARFNTLQCGPTHPRRKLIVAPMSSLPLARSKSKFKAESRGERMGGFTSRDGPGPEPCVRVNAPSTA